MSNYGASVWEVGVYLDVYGDGWMDGSRMCRECVEDEDEDEDGYGMRMRMCRGNI